MAKIDLQYDLTNHTPADASPVQANFSRLEQHVNQELIERGGTVAMTAQLKLAGDPIAPLDAVAKQYIDLLLPIGVTLPFTGVTIPGAKWKIANGEPLEIAAYPELYAVIGLRWNPAAAAGTFNLPNLADKVMVGAGSYAPGATGGSPVSSLPDHGHTFTGSGSGTLDTTEADTNHVHLMSQHKHSMDVRTDDPGNHGHGWQSSPTLNVWHNNQAVGLGGLTAGGNMGAVGWNWDGSHTHRIQADTQDGGQTNTGYQSDAPAVWGGDRYKHKHQFSFTPAGTVATKSQLAPAIPGGTAVTAANSNYPPYVVVNFIIRVA